MMKIYNLTETEVWALATLLYLPIENGSILAQWLVEFDAHNIDSVTEGAVNTLEAKGVIDPQRGQDIIPEGLLEALTVLAVSSVRLTAAIQRNGKFTWSTFGQLEETVVQYEISGDNIQIHSPDRGFEMGGILVPDWFQVEYQEYFNDALPIGAYLMLVIAFQLDDIQSVLEEDDLNPSFSKTDWISSN